MQSGSELPAYLGGAVNLNNGGSGLGGGGFGGGMGGGMGGPLASFLSGMFIDQGSPYEAAQGPYQQYMGQATGALNPFAKAGQGAIPQYQDYLNRMKNPSGFVNNLMGQYQESPYAKYMQQQSIRSGQNAASAGGLMGSTPFAQQLQQNASNISSQDMQNWLGRVLGVNTEYGQGVGNMMGMGASSANSLAQLYGRQAENMGQLAYGQEMGQNQNTANLLGGGIGLASSAFGF